MSMLVKGIKKLNKNCGLIVCMFFAACLVLAACNDGGGGGDDALSGYGGSIPRGDYVTAEIEGEQITIKNITTGTEKILSFGELPETLPDIGTSVIRMTEADTDGNYYLMALIENRVLGLHKMNSEMEPIISEMPVYMFKKSELTQPELKDRAFNFMELYAEDTEDDQIAVEVGIVGFDSDEAGSLYGAAYDSELDLAGQDPIYSITQDGFSLDLTEIQDDGSLVLWENGRENWLAATTLTGSAEGPIVMDHGPEAGGGAGFAFPQATEEDPDKYWDKVEGDYFLIAYYYDGNDRVVEYLRCFVSQKDFGSWDGSLSLYNLEGYPVVESMNISLLDDEIAQEIHDTAGFNNAASPAVKEAGLGRGIFQDNPEDPQFLVSFDPEGNYILGVKAASQTESLIAPVTGFGLGIRDRNWEAPVLEK